MSFNNRPTIGIVAAEPFKREYGDLFGILIKERNGNKLTVKLIKTIRGHKFLMNEKIGGPFFHLFAKMIPLLTSPLKSLQTT